MSYLFEESPKIAVYNQGEQIIYSTPFYEVEYPEINTPAAQIQKKYIEATILKVRQDIPISKSKLSRIFSISQALKKADTQFLETTPSSSEEKPFKPKNIPFQPLKPQAKKPHSSPGITIQTPSGYGKSWRSASFGMGLQSRARFTDTADGVLGFGVGLGNAQKTVGLDLSLGIADLDAFQNGSVSFKLHRRLPYDLALAVGIKNFVTFGGPDSGTTGYGVVTKMFKLHDNTQKPFSNIYVSAGIGGGQFRSESDIKNKRDSLSAFGSLAVRVAQPVNAIAEWTGQDLTMGLSIAPFRNIPLVITPAFSDITGSAGDGARFILGIGYSVSF